MLARSASTAAAGALCVGVFASCSSDDGTVLVLAAASLTDVMADLEAAFEQANPDVDLEVSTAGSNSLRVQVEQGAPADVVAFADLESMSALVESGEVDADTVEVFATNRLVLATPIDDPGDVGSIDDLADPARTIGACVPAVPCGSLALELLDVAGVDASLDTEEPDVRALVGKLVSGELDAGLVYATDVAAFADELRLVDTGIEVGNEYPIGVLAGSPSDDAARRFVEFVHSPTGAGIVRDRGFGAP